jgi:NAD(P)-dependent dehydrogenase (short-subunit alcohol dehydrogenase family)
MGTNREFEDKVALVTGGGSGIGRATALAFAAAGAKVVIGNRNTEAGEETVALIRQAGGTALFQRTDVTVAADVEALVARAVREYGALDCAFNNAGALGKLAPIAEQSEAEYDAVMNVNVKGVGLALKYELAQMRMQKRGAIVNNSSVTGIVGSNKGAGTYVAAKHAVIGLTKAAALENARLGIRVNAIAPAVVDTAMGATFATELGIAMADFGKGFPIGRVGRPEEIANAVLWLCSDRASFTTGHTLVADGAFTIQ